VVDEASHFGRGLPIVRRWRIFDELKALGVSMRPGHTDIAIEAKSVVARDQDGARVELPADTVIMAKGARGDLSIATRFEQAGYSVQSIGDCTGVGYIEGAIRSAALAARAL